MDRTIKSACYNQALLLAAWGEAYWVLADMLIEAKRLEYETGIAA